MESLLTRDDYLLLHDYRSYVDCQDTVSLRFADRDTWVRSSILNTARIGKFSSDRAIRQYCREVWNVVPVSANNGDDTEAREPASGKSTIIEQRASKNLPHPGR